MPNILKILWKPIGQSRQRLKPCRKRAAKTERMHVARTGQRGGGVGGGADFPAVRHIAFAILEGAALTGEGRSPNLGPDLHRGLGNGAMAMLPLGGRRRYTAKPAAAFLGECRQGLVLPFQAHDTRL